jgi:NitT/TauT family transport system substrate-binding protein
LIREINLKIAKALGLDLPATCSPRRRGVRSGVGTIVLNARRGDGPKACFNFTMPVIVTTDRLSRGKDTAARATKAVMATLATLKRDVSFARRSPASCFRKRSKPDPPQSAVVQSGDLGSVHRRHDGVRTRRGAAAGHPRYDQVVAQQFRHLWTA